MNFKRFVRTAVFVSAAVMLAMYLMQKYSAPKGGQVVETPAASAPAVSLLASGTSRPQAATSPSAGKPATAPASEAQWGNTAPSLPQVITLGSLADDSGYKVQVVLTNTGAAIESVKLTDYFVTVRDKRTHEKNPQAYDEALNTDPKLKGHYEVLKPVLATSGPMYSLATEKIHFPKEGITIDLAGPRWKMGPVETTEKGQQVVFVSEVFRGGKGYATIRKTYRLDKGSYSLSVNLEVINGSLAPDGTDAIKGSGEKIECDLTQFGPTGVPREAIQGDKRNLAWAQIIKGDIKVNLQDMAADKNLTMWPAIHLLGTNTSTDAILWVGETNKFFTSIVTLVPPKGDMPTDVAARATFFDAGLSEEGDSKAYLTGLKLGPYELPDGETQAVSLDVFAGPKKLDLLESPLYTARRYQDVVEISSSCTYAPLTKGMIWLLNVFSKFTFGNYGLAIILLVAMVRLCLHPLTKKSQVSMSKMQTLQPELNKIKEKYKDDKAAINQETMKLYKQAGAGPLLGCLPMLLQMPIWVALYTALSASVELRHAGFLPFWITDLAAPDALIPFAHVITVPMVGWQIHSFNLLPVLLTIAMILQQKFTPTTSASMDEAQAKQQKQMMYFMNGFMLLIFYNLPSGLTLYVMTSTFAGVAEQYVIRKHIREKQALAAASVTTVSMPGKYFRGNKPKKPKNPYQM